MRSPPACSESMVDCTCNQDSEVDITKAFPNVDVRGEFAGEAKSMVQIG